MGAKIKPEHKAVKRLNPDQTIMPVIKKCFFPAAHHIMRFAASTKATPTQILPIKRKLGVGRLFF
jgi:hypothetical protein